MTSTTQESNAADLSIVNHIRGTTHINVIKVLISQNPQVMNQLFEADKSGLYTLLDFAICCRDAAFVQDIINTYHPPLTFSTAYPGVKHNPYIFHAYEHEKYDVLDVLLEMGADPNEKDKEGIPLLNTVATDGNITVLNILLKYGKTDINITDDESCNAAIHAARRNRLGVLDLLIRRGIDIDHQDDSGATALMHAAIKKSYECLKILVQNRAKLNVKDNDGLTAINYAELGLLNDATSSRLCLEYLLKHGAQKYIEFDDIKQHTTIRAQSLAAYMESAH